MKETLSAPVTEASNTKKRNEPAQIQKRLRIVKVSYLYESGLPLWKISQITGYSVRVIKQYLAVGFKV